MNFRLSQWHENDKLVAVAQTIPGRLVLWLLVMLLLVWHNVGELTMAPFSLLMLLDRQDANVLMMAAFTLVMLLPAHRRIVLSGASIALIAKFFLEMQSRQTAYSFLTVGIPDPLALLNILVGTLYALAGLYLCFFMAQRFQQWPGPLRRHPLISLHVVIWVALTLSTLPWLGVFSVLPYFAWRLSYMLLQASRGKVQETRFFDHLFYLVPVFGGSNTPYGKGLDYLSRREATDLSSIARSQLAGIKLLLLAILWTYLLDFIHVALLAQKSESLAFWPAEWSLGISGLLELLRTGEEYSWYHGWVAIYLELVIATLKLAIYGHVVIGCLRLLGFNVFRNTYKPLLSESIVEFWNRYSFYFKELLVEFFFYPVYLRLRSLSPNSRMFAAVFAAAFVGNMYFHLLASPQSILQLEFAQTWATWSPRLVYCFLLALGIWLSMLRQQKQRQASAINSLPRRLSRIAGVWTFYAIIHIWNVHQDSLGVTDCLRFFLSLFAI